MSVNVKLLTAISALFCAGFIAATSARAGDVYVESVDCKLPSDGSDVEFKLKAEKEDDGGDGLIIYEINIDNTPTGDEDLCTFGLGGNSGILVICEESDYRIIEARIEDSLLRPGGFPGEQANNDVLGIRPMFSIGAGGERGGLSDAEIPVAPGDEFVLILDTENGFNDVELELTVGFTGKARKIQCKD